MAQPAEPAPCAMAQASEPTRGLRGTVQPGVGGEKELQQHLLRSGKLRSLAFRKNLSYTLSSSKYSRTNAAIILNIFFFACILSYSHA